MPKGTPEPNRAERDRNMAMRKRLAAITLVVVLLLFIAQIVTLAMGLIEVSWVILAIIVVGWFVLRSYQKRYPV